MVFTAKSISKDVKDDADHQHKTTFAYYLFVCGERGSHSDKRAVPAFF